MIFDKISILKKNQCTTSNDNDSYSMIKVELNEDVKIVCRYKKVKTLLWFFYTTKLNKYFIATQCWRREINMLLILVMKGLQYFFYDKT